MINGQELSLALGEPVRIDGFANDLSWYCHPFKLSELNELTLYLSHINREDLESNFNEECFAPLSWLLNKSFHIENEQDFQKLLDSITKENFKEIIDDIVKINGVSENVEKSSSPSNPLDWETSVSAIAVYAAMSTDEIKSLTLNQFNSLLEFINAKISYEFKQATVGFSSDKDYITADDYPIKPKKPKKRLTTLADLAKLTKI